MVLSLRRAAGVAGWLARGASVLLIVSTLCFFMMERLPGDAAFNVAAARYDVDRVTPQVARSVREQLKLDQPVSHRFTLWLTALGQGRLGLSAVTRQPVVSGIRLPLLRSLVLDGIAWPITIMIGLGLGLWLGSSRRGLASIQIIASIFAAVPLYVAGLMLSLLFAIHWRLLPAGGYLDGSALVLPAASLAITAGVRLAVVSATAIASANRHPSVAFARMKGLGTSSVVLFHTLPLAAPAMIAFAFVSLSSLIEGTILIENLFAYPGIGQLLINSILARDVPVVQALALAIAALVFASNTLSIVLTRRLVTRDGARV